MDVSMPLYLHYEGRTFKAEQVIRVVRILKTNGIRCRDDLSAYDTHSGLVDMVGIGKVRGLIVKALRAMSDEDWMLYTGLPISERDWLAELADV